MSRVMVRMTGFHVLAGAAVVVGLVGCSNREQAGIEAAKKEAAAEATRKVASREVNKVRPPVTGGRKVPCGQLIDLPSFQVALDEREELTLRDQTRPSGDPTAVCSLIRGGKKLSAREQEARIKKEGRLGALPGDEVCNITVHCGTLEEEGRFRNRCVELKGTHDEQTLGSYACVRVTAQGADDVNTFRLLDPDTRCVFDVRGGPSVTDNAFIAACARAARDLIGPTQIGSTAPPTEPETAESAAAPAQ